MRVYSIKSRSLKVRLFFFSLSLLIFGVSYTTWGSESSSETWLKLLHYKPNILGSGWTSQIDGPDFYLCKQGKWDPECEWQASLREFQALHEKAICQFPARVLVMNRMRALGTSSSKVLGILESCVEFQKFRRRLSPKSVSLIFSSHYLNNPSSAFGHTFLRFNKEVKSSKGEPLEFMDLAIDFAATVDTQNALMYAFKGIFGFFKGEFAAVPYFMKVRQYASFEARDIWSYHLNLTDEEIETLVAHLWEMGHTWMDYYYFTENCSYHILSLLEAVRPSLRLTSELPFYVIPTDTLKVAIESSGLIGRVDFRPSLRRSFAERWARMNDEEHEALKSFIQKRDRQILKAFSPERQAAILEAAGEFLDFRYPYEIQLPTSNQAMTKREILGFRSQLVVSDQSPRVVPETSEKPEGGHDSRRAMVRFIQSREKESGIGFGIRAALHDLLDDSKGYPPNAEIEFLNLEARYLVQQRQWWFDDLTLFQVQSFAPLQSMVWPWSWRIKLGAQTQRDRSCDHCVAGFLEFGAGGTLEVVPRHFYLIGLGQAEVTGSPRLQGEVFSPALGPRLGILASLNSSVNFSVQGDYRYRFLLDRTHSWRISAETRWALMKALAVGLSAKRFQDDFEAGGAFYFYF